MYLLGSGTFAGRLIGLPFNNSNRRLYIQDQYHWESLHEYAKGSMQSQ